MQYIIGKRLLAILACVMALSVIGSPQQTKAAKTKAPPTISLTMDTQLTSMEKQLVPAAEAMPADKYSFVPDGENFKGSRTFALEVKHVAAANFAVFSEILGQAPPAGISFAGANNGPDSQQTKAQIVQQNALAPINDPNLPFSQPSSRSPLALASFACAHAGDHYGQMVVYLRMNGITPPASKGQPPANPGSL